MFLFVSSSFAQLEETVDPGKGQGIRAYQWLFVTKPWLLLGVTQRTLNAWLREPQLHISGQKSEEEK